jgi:hypothetical protein
VLDWLTEKATPRSGLIIATGCAARVAAIALKLRLPNSVHQTIDDLGAWVFYTFVVLGIVCGLWERQKTRDMLAQVEAEKRVMDPRLPNTSTIPEVQVHIDRIVRETGETPVDR